MGNYYVGSKAPSFSPTQKPTTYTPTYSETSEPTYTPTYSETSEPTNKPTHKPTHAPTDSTEDGIENSKTGPPPDGADKTELLSTDSTTSTASSILGANFVETFNPTPEDLARKDKGRAARKDAWDAMGREGERRLQQGEVLKQQRQQQWAPGQASQHRRLESLSPGPLGLAPLSDDGSVQTIAVAHVVVAAVLLVAAVVAAARFWGGRPKPAADKVTDAGSQ